MKQGTVVVITEIDQRLFEVGQNKHQTLITILSPVNLLIIRNAFRISKQKVGNLMVSLTYTAQCRGENSDPLVE